VRCARDVDLHIAGDERRLPMAVDVQLVQEPVRGECPLGRLGVDQVAQRATDIQDLRAAEIRKRKDMHLAGEFRRLTLPHHLLPPVVQPIEPAAPREEVSKVEDVEDAMGVDCQIRDRLERVSSLEILGDGDDRLWQHEAVAIGHSLVPFSCPDYQGRFGGWGGVMSALRSV